ncbi:hypothetical protein SLUN_38885 (plasmid) [Streptomyces lunaelactis]|uniref:Uncharacterized protein n=1 Tax=Streptomyces lunaelactis TaxID=1535768 RepID=A0A2R4TFY0_9ACTN|nr:hypothetical protein [Streptomyces lunaelactis]AVZ77997.1 hypothetical protein SLUN_38885 [Streptomyces lunaelactis]NUK84927.1 hypothetical protein [Streptomyces lunaelactis]
MANIWIMRNCDDVAKYGEKRSTLVRADALSYVRASVGSKVVAADVASQEVVTLVDEQDGAHQGRPSLPPNFHIALLARINELRKWVQGEDDEDRFVVAEVRDGKWVWGTYKLSELPQD